MDALEDIDGLAVELELARSAGRPISPSDLCPDSPGDQSELARRSQILQKFESTFGRSAATTGDGRLTDLPPLVLGCVLGRELGRGGMGVVYRAWQTQLDREVAVKVMRSASLSAGHAWRFAQEARVLARLRHDHIVPVYKAEFNCGQPYFVMELVRGGNLAEALDRFADDPMASADLLEQVARAVHHAHEQGVLHRDLKPANILLDEHGRPLVGDFGLARLCDGSADSAGSQPASETLIIGAATVTDAVIGTPPYMAPEQFLGPVAPVGPYTDVWALGVILYQLLTGKRPFRGDAPGGYARAIREGVPPVPRALCPRLDRGLEAIVLRCLTKAPAGRYPTALALADDLARWRRGDAPAAYPDRWPQRAWRWCRRRPLVAVAVSLVALASTVWVAVAYHRHPDRVLERIDRDLADGRKVTLVSAAGPPAHFAWAEGGADAKASTEPDSPFSVSAHVATLVELWATPPPAFRLHAEVRHDDGHGFAGIYFDHRRAGPSSPMPSCYVLSFADRGMRATRIKLPDGLTGSPVALEFRYFQPRMGLGSIEAFQILNEQIINIPPAPPLAGPWRKLTIDVSASEVSVAWATKPGGAEQVVRVERAELERFATELPRHDPRMSGYAWRPTERGSVGLYVADGAAAYRNVVLEPIKSEPQP